MGRFHTVGKAARSDRRFRILHLRRADLLVRLCDCGEPVQVEVGTVRVVWNWCGDAEEDCGRGREAEEWIRGCEEKKSVISDCAADHDDGNDLGWVE